MPSLNDLLRQSMLFTAAAPQLPTAITSAFRSPKPSPTRAADREDGLDEATVRHNPIWRLSWDPASPGTFRDITICSRGMGMDYGMAATAYDKMEFRSVQVRRRNGTHVDLLLDPAHMIGAFFAPEGSISPLADNFTGKANWLWQLETRIDSSMLVVFGYKLDQKHPSPLTKAECDALGDDLMPNPGDEPAGVTFTATSGASAWAHVDHTRYIVAVELVLCRENNDFVPGGLIGFARIQPHLMVWGSERLDRVEGTIVMARPSKGMSHDSDVMHETHKALVVADTNEAHTLSGLFERPIPYTDALYDYYEIEPTRVFEGRKRKPYDHPLQREGEITLADSRFTEARTIENAVTRRSQFAVYSPNIVKTARQGQFDNVHIAPRMRLTMEVPFDGRGRFVVDDDIAMLNMCLHDCCHMHVRWSKFLTDAIIAGWKNGRPNVEPGAPQVPENQTVFASFPNEHTLRYRAVAESVDAGALTILCHHGIAYAVDEWPTSGARAAINALHFGIKKLARAGVEPYFDGEENDRWALFYYRIRYTGELAPDGSGTWVVTPRSDFSLETCMA